MVAGSQRKQSPARRRWAYGLIDLLVVASCSVVFVVVVTGSKGATPRRASVEQWKHDPDLAPAGLQQSAAHDLRPAGRFDAGGDGRCRCRGRDRGLLDHGALEGPERQAAPHAQR